MPSADWLEFSAKTSAFREMIENDATNRMDAYHRKIQIAALVQRRLSNPRSRKYNLRVDRIWAAHQVAWAIRKAAAADVASAKAMRRADQIFTELFTGGAAASGDAGGFDLDG